MSEDTQAPSGEEDQTPGDTSGDPAPENPPVSGLAAGDEGCENSELDSKILRFETDLDIAHQIIHGDANTEVQTENGPVPTLARRISQLTVEMGLGKQAFAFPPVTELVINHPLNSVIVDETIRDTDGVRHFANSTVVSPTQIRINFTSPVQGTIFLHCFQGDAILLE